MLEDSDAFEVVVVAVVEVAEAEGQAFFLVALELSSEYEVEILL